jgi:hypothetical protein
MPILIFKYAALQFYKVLSICFFSVMIRHKSRLHYACSTIIRFGFREWSSRDVLSTPKWNPHNMTFWPLASMKDLE